MRKIYITGCARSGTTMLKYLMWAFRNVTILPGERAIDIFNKSDVRQQSLQSNVVAKRKASILAGVYPVGTDPDDEEGVREYRELMLDYIRRFNLTILDIIRDPRDVMTSRHHSKPDEYYVPLNRWWNQYKDIEWLMERWDKIKRVKYEQILKEPGKVQKEIGAEFELEAEHSFSDYPDFVKDSDDLDEDQVKAVEGLRPLDPEHIGRWEQRDPEFILEIARNYNRINKGLVEMGYEENEDWYEEFNGVSDN